jgi:glycerol-3-phosphate dehydrogenase (NAD(P)+)
MRCVWSVSWMSRFREIGDSKHQLAAHCYLAVNRGGSRSSTDAAPHAAKLHFEPQRIPRPHLALEAHAVDPGKEGHLAPVLLGSQECNRSDLRQRFDDQDAWHHGVIGKVSLEEWLVDRDILDANSANAIFDLFDSVDEQERKAMRDNGLDLLRVEHGDASFLLRSALTPLAESRNERPAMSMHETLIGGPILVVGAGAWGTTLARMLSQRGLPTVLLAHTASQADALRVERENRRYLPGIELPEQLQIESDIPASVSLALVLLVVPSQHMRSAAEQLRPHLGSVSLVVSCAKGLERSTLQRMTEVVCEAAAVPSARVCALSGPNLAREIAIGLPASTVVASTSATAASLVQRVLQAPQLRVYTSSDVIGVELGGALKNVIALAAGAVDGFGGGQNAKAALIARGLAEMTRLGVAAGANPLTFGGLSGLGDLIATCESPLSRNRTFGEALGRGVPAQEAAGSSPHVVEGVVTTDVALRLAERLGVELPIAQVVSAVLSGRLSVGEAIDALMSREARPELDRNLFQG